MTLIQPGIDKRTADSNSVFSKTFVKFIEICYVALFNLTLILSKSWPDTNKLQIKMQRFYKHIERSGSNSFLNKCSTIISVPANLYSVILETWNKSFPTRILVISISHLQNPFFDAFTNSGIKCFFNTRMLKMLQQGIKVYGIRLCKPTTAGGYNLALQLNIKEMLFVDHLHRKRHVLTTQKVELTWWLSVKIWKNSYKKK